MEWSLDQLDVPRSFLVFPGEVHGLRMTPWNGHIELLAVELA
jgi:hypothetical protein